MTNDKAVDATNALKRGDLDEARRLFALSVKTDPANESAHLQLAEICFTQGDLTAAHDWMGKAFKLNPNQQNLESFGIAKVKLIESKERGARAQSSLPTDHMQSVNDDPFHYTRADIVALDTLVSKTLTKLKPTATYVNLLATSQFLSGELESAEKAYHMLAEVNADLPYADVRFDSAFYRNLENADDNTNFRRAPRYLGTAIVLKRRPTMWCFFRAT